MIKYALEGQQWWEILTLTDAYHDANDSREFSEEELADLLRVQNEFKAWQQKLADRFGVEKNWGLSGHDLIDDYEDNNDL